MPSLPPSSSSPGTESQAGTKPDSTKTFWSLRGFLLLLYPSLTLLGQLVQWTNSAPDSYFSDKRNILNRFVVKQGWFWLTLVFLTHLPNAASLSPPKHSNPHLAKVVRYSAITLWWFLFSQWCFGLPLMDRVFILTGGACQSSESGIGGFQALSAKEIYALGSASCKQLGGKWEGGTDPSGHMFLLTIGSLFIWEEVLIPVLKLAYFSPSSSEGKKLTWQDKFAIAIVTVFGWMLLMTNVYYFHSFMERILGMAWAFVGYTVIYEGLRRIGSIGWMFEV